MHFSKILRSVIAQVLILTFLLKNLDYKPQSINQSFGFCSSSRSDSVSSKKKSHHHSNHKHSHKHHGGHGDHRGGRGGHHGSHSSDKSLCGSVTSLDDARSLCGNQFVKIIAIILVLVMAFW